MAGNVVEATLAHSTDVPAALAVNEDPLARVVGQELLDERHALCVHV